MNKEDFLKIKGETNLKIKELVDKLKATELEYINSNAQFVAWEKVVVVEPERKRYSLKYRKDIYFPESRRFAFFSHYEVDYNGTILPKLKKCKKDGTVSSFEDYCSGAKIEKLNR